MRGIQRAVKEGAVGALSPRLMGCPGTGTAGAFARLAAGAIRPASRPRGVADLRGVAGLRVLRALGGREAGGRGMAEA